MQKIFLFQVSWPTLFFTPDTSIFHWGKRAHPKMAEISRPHHIFTVNIVKKHAWTVHLETYKPFSFDVETSSHYLYIKGLYEILVLAGQFLWWSSTKYVFCVDRKSKIATTTTKIKRIIWENDYIVYQKLETIESTHLLLIKCYIFCVGSQRWPPTTEQI